MNIAVALKLGRTSNLPTVWTNAAAGWVLAGGAIGDARLPLLVAGLSLCYLAGMFLNDAFDREFDARHRPERPIPAGEVTARAVFGAGFAMLALGVIAVGLCGLAFPGGTQWRPAVAALALAGTIVFYDLHHKGNPLSPFVMGLCRMLVYVCAAFAFVAEPPARVFGLALLLLAYLIGLTYIAKQEHLDRLASLWPLAFLGAPVAWGLMSAVESLPVAVAWLLFTAWTAWALRYLRRRGPGDVPRAVGALLAGICLWDALVLAACGAHALALGAMACFALTRLFQRYVAPT